jgi:hypothetical protein
MYALEYWSAVFAYPIDSGGRPLNSWPIFVLPPFEIGVLAAAIAGFVALIMLCDLPRLDHQVFECAAVERASADRYFLVMAAPTEAKEAERLRALLAEQRTLSVSGPLG